jgi:hypothetical protein
VERLSTAATALLLAGLTSCVRGSWDSARDQVPVPHATIASLEPGVSTLGDCLDGLGAPLFVWEVDASSYGIAFGWNDAEDWGVNVSVPVARGFSASVDYADTNLDLEGLVLFFDADDRLLRIDRGRLSDLVPDRQRPADLPDQLGADGDPG